MATSPLELQPFRRRIRWLRLMRGAAWGAAMGSGVAVVLAAADALGWWFTGWAWLGGVVAAASAVGGLVGWILPLSEAAVAQSIDRRATLKDRLQTAMERKEGSEDFDGLLRHDAERELLNLKASEIYPFRWSRWHSGAIAGMALAALVFLLGNTPLTLDPAARAAAKENRRAGEEVERVMKPLADVPDKALTDEERKLRAQLERFAREMQRNRLSKEEALQRGNELAEKAEKLVQDRFKQAAMQFDQAQSALDRLNQQKLEAAGLGKANPELMKMSPADLGALFQKEQKLVDELEKQLQDPNLSREERAKLEAKLEAAKKRLAEIALSKRAQEFLERMTEHPVFKEIQEMLKKMQADANRAAEGEQPELTEEQLQAMRDKIEELAKQLADEEALRDFLEAMREALKNGQMCKSCQGIGAGLTACLKIPNMGQGGRGRDDLFLDTGKVNTTEQESESKGKTQNTMIKGERREGKGEETYIEIRGPAQLGKPSAVPYTKVLPKYQKQAEQALKRQQIPKQHEKRVREYFESLGAGR